MTIKMKVVFSFRHGDSPRVICGGSRKEQPFDKMTETPMDGHKVFA